MLGERSDQRSLWKADRLYLDHVGKDTFYGLLASLRGQLFREADFAGFYCADNGRDSVPPSLLATALLLQTHDKVSDAEAKARADFDIRWKVALGIEIEDRPFAKSTLQVFSAQLILHDKVRAVFESSLRLARQSGYLKKRGMRVALDTTNILGRGAVKDTCNLLADGIVKLMRALAYVEQTSVREWAESQGYERYLGSSVKGESAIDWSDKRARAALLGEIVADADRLLEVSRQAQGALPEGSPERQGIVAAAELLGQLLLQDVERTGEGIGLRNGVSRDRMMSVHDLEMRHGHKSSSRQFDGHKAAIVVDTDSQLTRRLRCCRATLRTTWVRWNWWNGVRPTPALQLRRPWEMPLMATGTPGRPSPTRDAAWSRECRGVPTGATSRKRTSGLTWRREPAPVRRGMLPAPYASRADAPAPRGAPTSWEDSGSMRRCAAYVRCGPGAWLGRPGGEERCNCTLRRHRCSRPAPCSRARPLPDTVNGEWRWSTVWPGWCSRGFAKPATSGGPKPGSSCTWRPRWPT